MSRSTHRATETDPLINGGSYRHKNTGEEALVMGVRINAVSKAREGRLYTWTSGGHPVSVIENTASFESWELIAAPTMASARAAIASHKAARVTKAKDKAKVLATARA